MDSRSLAREMFDEAVAEEQSVRRVPDEEVAARVRHEVRRLGRDAEVRLRTARIDDVVAVVRLDAAVWTEDAATMRRKLTPPG